MKKLMKLFIVSLILITTVFSTNAQKVSLEERVQQQTTDLVTALELDEEMSAQILEVKLQYAQERKGYQKEFRQSKKAGEEVSKEDKKAKMKPTYKAENQAIKAIIGKDHLKAYNAYKKELKAAKKKG